MDYYILASPHGYELKKDKNFSLLAATTLPTQEILIYKMKSSFGLLYKLVELKMGGSPPGPGMKS
jgi:hypothetical protein